MNWNRKLIGLVLLVAVAVGGYFVSGLIPRLIADFRATRELSPTWAWIYLATAAASGAAMAALAGWTLWILVSNTLLKARRQRNWARNPSQMSLGQQQAEIDEHLAAGRQLADDASLSPAAREPIRRALAAIEAKRHKQSLEIVAFGTISSGKSAVLNALAGRQAFRTDVLGGTTVARSEVPWPGNDKVVLVDTPGLGEIDGHQRQELAKLAARDADLVLFVVDGPLRDFESAFVGQLVEMEKRILVCLNKEDWFSAPDRQRLVEQIAEQLAGRVAREDVVSLQAQPAARVRTRVLSDGTHCDETVEVEPDIQALARRMQSVVRDEGRALLVANLLLQSRGLAAEGKAQVRAQLDERASAVVDRAMWQAGAAAALSPLPAIDLLAGAGITSHMVLELARVYRQSVDIETVSRLLAELGKQLVSVAGANVAAPAAASALASLLKSVPGVGTVSGGVLQGLVQMLVTRWIGRVFISYFRADMQTPEIGWASLARAKWQEVTRPEELAKLVSAGLARLGKDPK